MSKEFLIEMIGYIASIIVLLSFLTTSVVKLRVANVIGSIIYTIYALIIRSYPTAIMNFCLACINIFYLLKMSRVNKEYEVTRVKPDEGYVGYFLNYYDDDIRKYTPDVESVLAASDYALMTSTLGEPAGLLLGKRNGPVLDLLMEYTTIEYRDFTVGNRIYPYLKEDGIEKVIFRGKEELMSDYLRKFDYRREDDGYVKYLNQ